MEKYDLDWQLIRVGRDGTRSQAFPARVPGSVQLDYAAYAGLPDYRADGNFRAYDGLEDDNWIYRADLPDGENWRLVGRGVDYRYEIRVDRSVVYAYEGLVKQFDIALPEGRVLEIEIYPAPKLPEERGRAQAAGSCKPAVNYGWDFQPRLIPLGIWDDLELIRVPAPRIESHRIRYTLSEDLRRAEISLEYKTESGGVTWRFGDTTVRAEASEGTLAITLDCPRLWYPNGEGEQFRYESEVRSDGGHCVRRRIGLRRVRLVAKSFNWQKYEVPATQCYPPMTLELNGKRIFAKGSNYVVPDVFYSEMTRERYDRYLRPVRDAHMNILRLWGGCCVNKEDFYDLCDEYGILVWQEFPLACNDYRDTPAYLAQLESEAEALLERVAPHACVAILCGGNELFLPWSGMTEQSKALRMLNALSLERLPDVPFLMTSPVYGVRHGSYGYYYRGLEPVAVIRSMTATAYTEFGVPSLSSRACFDNYITEETGHFDANAWEAFPESWAYPTDVASYLGEIAGLDDWIEKSQYLQSVIYQTLFEEARRQCANCSMAINWDLCDSWPCFANNSLIEYGGTPKPAYYAVERSLRPAVLTLDTDTILLGSAARIRICLVNDSPISLSGTVTATLEQGARRLALSAFVAPTESGGRTYCDAGCADLSEWDDGPVRLTLNGLGADNEYGLIVRKAK